MQGWVANLIDLIGDSRLGPAFGRFVGETLRPDFMHIFRLSQGGPRVIESFSYDGSGRAEHHAAIYRERGLWRFDEAMVEGSGVSSGRPVVLRQDGGSFSSWPLQRYRTQLALGARTMIVGRGAGAGAAVGISMAWLNDSDLPAEGDAGFDQIVELGFPIISKHLEVRGERDRIGDATSSLPEIEMNLREALGPTRPREVQVGARLIYGQTASDIAGALKIGRETVVTHRKRLYEHLDVANGRALLLWYCRGGWIDRTPDRAARISH